jgi:hypothetical protein
MHGQNHVKFTFELGLCISTDLNKINENVGPLKPCLQDVYYLLQYILLILCFVDHASLYNLVNETNLVHKLFLVYLYSSISTYFG